jgi:hypothetical protein
MNLWLWLMPHKRVLYRQAQQALAQEDDIQSVGLLAETLWLGDEPLRLQAEAVLTRLLPRLGPEQGDLLNRHQWDCLCRVLPLYRRKIDLVIAILKALDTLGEWTAFRYVSELADSDLADSAERKLVQAAASECLRNMQERFARTLPGRTLLRSSYPPSVPADASRPPPTKSKSSE